MSDRIWSNIPQPSGKWCPRAVTIIRFGTCQPLSETGKGGVTQLVKWYTERTFRRDQRGEEVLFTGPVSLTYDSPSVIDPVHNLAIGQIMLGMYAEYDTKLQVIDILTVPEALAFAAASKFKTIIVRPARLPRSCARLAR